MQRTVMPLFADNFDLRATLTASQSIQQRILPACCTGDQPLAAPAPHHATSYSMKSVVSSQQPCTAI
ncbi:MAG: hypothetical protein RMJ54_17755 [Roseiflexaceae bacterium]|nr:hypothetical protein [Roseiflexus sp.]MDW8234621.1 hypothetical protein [Roseiflexaceae bacterium]